MKIQELNEKQKIFEGELMNYVVLYPRDCIKSSQIVSADDFWFYKKEYLIALDCAINNKNIEAEFEEHKILFSKFFNSRISLRTIEDICRDLKEISNTRKVYAILEQSLHTMPMQDSESFVADVQRRLIGGISRKESEKSEVKNIIEEYKTLQNFYKEKFKDKKGIIGVSTGYEKIDEIIDGFRPEHLWVVGGYTNMGKTQASLNFVSNLVKQGKRVVCYSLEMSQTDVMSRILGIMTEQSGLTILKGYPHDTEKVEEAIKLLIESNLVIHTTKYALADIQFSMYEENLKKPVDLFVIDFIQNITVKDSKSEYETITTSALELQQMAKKLKCPVLVVSQISNEGARTASESVMSFKGSGAIASSADLAIEIQSDESEQSEAKRKLIAGEPLNVKWVIRKNRHGRTGNIEMTFNGRTGLFKVRGEVEKPVTVKQEVMDF